VTQTQPVTSQAVPIQTPPAPQADAIAVKLANMTALYSDKVTDNGR
jgi:hypothetical protein